MTHPDLSGYTDVFSVAPGETVSAKLSVSTPAYEAHLVELIHGDEDARGPGFVERELDAPFNGAHRGRVQHARAGSAVVIPDDVRLGSLGFDVTIWMRPTAPALGHPQTIASRLSMDGRGWVLALDPEGHCSLSIGDPTDVVLRLDEPVRAGVWTEVMAGHNPATEQTVLRQRTEQPHAGATEQQMVARFAAAGTFSGALVLAARMDPQAGLHDFFNGKLEGPALRDTDGELLASWDFQDSLVEPSNIERGSSGLRGATVNRPCRAMTDHTWDGSCHDPRYAPDGYGAIAFHEDDLDDAGWNTDLEYTVPMDLPSGVYAFRVRAADGEDHVPFIVRPPRERATADVALVIPTFSYMAYANDDVTQLAADTWKFVGLDVTYDPLDHQVLRHPEWGRSLYDVHRDGTGCAQSSRLRPNINLRPRYRWWATAGAQYLASDLYIVHWLRHIGIKVDLITDEDVHTEGFELLSKYRTILTGTHPEYVSSNMLDALEQYLAADGHLMYMGGNGFYWVTSVPADTTHTIEVRRGNAGTRAWDSAPGEEHHAFTGERGGLWRHRGRTPNQLVGIGFAAQGWSDPARGYQRTARSYEPDVAWVFEGVDSGLIGNFGLAMNGAAGDELDRFDASLGSPQETVVLATSGDHGRYYTVAHEDLLSTSTHVTGETHPGVRADLTLLQGATGGSVFSVGSKSWCASLSWNGYDNDIARVSTNVLRRFLSRSAP